MATAYSIINKLKFLLESNPIILVLILSLIFTCCFRLIFKMGFKWLKIFFCMLVLSGFIYYFGFFSVLMIFFIFFACYIGGCKFIKFQKDGLVGSLVFFFIFLEFYILISLFLGPLIGLVICIFLLSFVILHQNIKNVEFTNNFRKDSINFLKKLNLIDILLIFFCFILGSFPQSHWDAVHANLYNSKWYIENNSFRFLPESVSSLYPQNAIAYYSFFYQIGKVRGLQFAYLLPLIFTILLFKRIQDKLNLSGIVVAIFYTFLITPIVIFQSSNGYYDLLVFSVILGAIYISYFNVARAVYINLLLSLFLIGFAAAMKYFPILFAGLPIVSYLIDHRLKNGRSLLIILLGILIVIFPLFIWMFRSYYYTGSPVFPFFQSLFPTPGWWPDNDILEDNFMIKTPMTLKEWLLGGFITYPVLTWFNTQAFIEATVGYTGLGYVTILVLEFLVIFNALKKLLNKNFSKLDIYIIYSLAVFVLVGVVTRYYRYLWPYQLILALLTIIYMPQVVNIQKIRRLTYLGFISAIVMVNIVALIYYYSYLPIIYKQFLKPDYYYITSDDINPKSFVNIVSTQNDHKKINVLDASSSYLERFNFEVRVYQCSWYWIGVLDILSKSKKDKDYAAKILKNFDYVITDNKTFSEGLCGKLLGSNLNILDKVYTDLVYSIYKVKDI